MPPPNQALDGMFHSMVESEARMSPARFSRTFITASEQRTEVRPPSARTARRASSRPRLWDAARTVLVAWDEPDQSGLAAALEALRTALPIRAPALRRTAPRQPRPDTKQAQVLVLLRRPEGASGPTLIEATG